MIPGEGLRGGDESATLMKTHFGVCDHISFSSVNYKNIKSLGTNGIVSNFISLYLGESDILSNVFPITYKNMYAFFSF